MSKNDKIKIAIIAAVTVLLLAGIGTFLIIYSQQDRDYAANPSADGLTKAEWILQLADTFELKDCVEKTPYYSDVTADKNCFTAVQSCVEWEILDGKGKFEPDEKVTNEFAIVTGVKAVGLELINATVLGSGAQSDKELVNYFSQFCNSVSPQASLTQESAAVILDTLGTIYESLDLQQKVDYTLGSNVIEADGNQVQYNGDSATLNGITANVGDILYTKPDAKYSSGKAVTVQSVNGNTVTVTNAKEEDVLKEADIIGSFSPEILGLDDENWELEIIENPEDMHFDGKEAPVVSYLGTAGNQQKSLPTDFDRNVNFGDVWIKLNSKIGSGLDVSGKLCLADLKVDTQFKMKGTEIKRAYVAFSTTVKFQVSVAGTKEIKPRPIKIPIRIAGIVGGDIIIQPIFGIKGTVTLQLSTTFSEGCSYKEGAFPKFFKKLTKPEGSQNFTVSAYAKAQIKLGAAFLAWDLFDFGFETGGVADAVTTPTECNDVFVYWIFSAFINSDDSLLGMIGVRAQWDIFDKDNSPLRKSSHVEDGEIVPACTRLGKTEESTTKASSDTATTAGTYASAFVDKLCANEWYNDMEGDVTFYRFDRDGKVTLSYYSEDGLQSITLPYEIVDDNTITFSHQIDDNNVTRYTLKNRSEPDLADLVMNAGGTDYQAMIGWKSEYDN